MISKLKGTFATRHLFSRIQRNFGLDTSSLFKPLSEIDPDMHKIIKNEAKRQKESICLIASENFSSKAVREALGSVLSNKYSEGYPNARYYGGNWFIDQAESLCQKRALEAFSLDSAKWGVNVQSLSGSPANFQVYTGLLQPHDRIMALDLPHGGHLSHGYQTDTRKVSAVSLFFESFPYRVDETTGLIDYDKFEEHATYYRPKLIVAGMSAYPRFFDYARIRKICDKVGAIMLADMAHISGMVAAGVIPSPFEYADVVTTTTHKSLRGPRGAMIFYRLGEKSKDAKTGEVTNWDLKSRIDNSVFPGLQGGPHNHTIGALAVALKLAKTTEFKEYQLQALKNIKVLGESLEKKGFKLATGGTDVHLILVNVKTKGVDGERVAQLFDYVNISLNKNTIPGDKSAVIPSGIRLGSHCMTTRGLVEKDFVEVANFIDRGIDLVKVVKDECGGSKVSDFKAWLKKNGTQDPRITKLRDEIISFSSQYPYPE